MEAVAMAPPILAPRLIVFVFGAKSDHNWMKGGGGGRGDEWI